MHSLNLRKENLSFDNILLINDASLVHKIFIFDLTMCSQSGRGRWECLFWAFTVWSKARPQKLWSFVRGKNDWMEKWSWKKSMKGEFKWDFERLKSDFCWIAKLLLEEKVILVLLNKIFVKYSETDMIILDWEIMWWRLINIWEARVRNPSEPLFF